MLLCVNIGAWAQDIGSKDVKLLQKKIGTTIEDSVRVKLLLEMTSFHLFKPGELKVDLDSAQGYLLRARQISDALRLKKLQHQVSIMEVVIVMERGDESGGRILFNHAVSEFRRTGDSFSEAELRFRFGIWLATRGTFNDEVLDNFRQAAQLYHAIKMTVPELNVLKEIASIHFDNGKIDLAERELMDVLEQYKAIKYPKIHYTYNLLSTISRVQGNFNKSLRFSMLSIQTMQLSGDTVNAANFYADLARIYMEIGDNQKGIEWYRKAIGKWRQHQRASFGVFVAAGYISEDLISKGKAKEALTFNLKLAQDLPPISIIQRACFAQNIASCYNALGDYLKAERFYLQSLDFYKTSHVDFEVSQEAQRSIGKFYLLRRSYDKAGNHLRAAWKASPQKLSTAALMDVHFMLFRVDSAQGNFLSAIAHQKMQKALNDSILDSRKTREIQELQIQYETEKRKKDLAVLGNKSRFQQSKLETANLTQKYTLACLALLLIILGLLYSRYQVNTKNNSELQVQKNEVIVKNHSLEKVLKEREWLLKEVHHRVKNNLQIVISLLNTQTSYLDNKFALNALKESQHRIFSISLIHQKLYQSDNLSSVDIKEYITELSAYLKDSLNPSGTIHFDFNIALLNLDINQAIPVGLILNEAITNAIKHAFKDVVSGIVNITIKVCPDQSVCLEINDNGSGFPQDFTIEGSKSLGMNLIKGLSSQLDGTFEIHRTQGITSLLIRFTPKYTSEDEGSL